MSQPVNLTTRCLQLHAHVAWLSGRQPDSFELWAGWPPAPLVNHEWSIQRAGLCDCAVQQRQRG